MYRKSFSFVMLFYSFFLFSQLNYPGNCTRACVHRLVVLTLGSSRQFGLHRGLAKFYFQDSDFDGTINFQLVIFSFVLYCVFFYFSNNGNSIYRPTVLHCCLDLVKGSTVHSLVSMWHMGVLISDEIMKII